MIPPNAFAASAVLCWFVLFMPIPPDMPEFIPPPNPPVLVPKPLVLDPKPPVLDPNAPVPELELLPKPLDVEPKLLDGVDPKLDPVLVAGVPNPFVAPEVGVVAPNEVCPTGNGAGACVVAAVPASSGSSFGILFPSLNLNLTVKTIAKYLGWSIIILFRQQQNCPRT